MVVLHWFVSHCSRHGALLCCDTLLACLSSVDWSGCVSRYRTCGESGCFALSQAHSVFQLTLTTPAAAREPILVASTNSAEGCSAARTQRPAAGPPAGSAGRWWARRATNHERALALQVADRWRDDGVRHLRKSGDEKPDSAVHCPSHHMDSAGRGPERRRAGGTDSYRAALQPRSVGESHQD